MKYLPKNWIWTSKKTLIYSVTIFGNAVTTHTLLCMHAFIDLLHISSYIVEEKARTRWVTKGLSTSELKLVAWLGRSTGAKRRRRREDANPGSSSAFPLSSTELRWAGLAFIRRTRDRGKKKLNNKGIWTSLSSILPLSVVHLPSSLRSQGPNFVAAVCLCRPVNEFG